MTARVRSAERARPGGARPARVLPGRARAAALAIGALAIGAAVIAPRCALAVSPGKAASEGNALYRDGRYAEARDRYLGAQADRPDAPELEFNIGDTFFQEGQPAQAIESFTKVAGNKSLASRIRGFASYNLGNALLKSGQFDKAIDAYRAALRLDPSDVDAKHNLELAMRKKEEAERKKEEEKEKQEGENGDEQKKKEQQEKGDDSDKESDQGGKNPDSTSGGEQNPPGEQEASAPPPAGPDSLGANPGEPREIADGQAMPRSDALRILEALEAQEMAQAQEKERQTLIKALLSQGKDW